METKGPPKARHCFAVAMSGLFPRRSPMSMTQEPSLLKGETLQQQLAGLDAFVRAAAHEGTPIHQAELGIWQRLLQLGRRALQQFLDLQGSGDQGEELTLP